MFVKCANCGYLTPESSALCKQCGAVASLPAREPEPAPVPEPVPSPTAAIPTMPPPDPSTAATGWGAPPPRPPVAPPPVPSMFPDPGARPPRRSVPTWSIVSGAVVVVIAMVVAGLAFTGGDDNVRERAGAAQARLAEVQADVARLDATTLTRADMGSEWTETEHRGLGPDELGWSDTCSNAPGLRTVATLGRAREFAYHLTTETNEGHAVFHIREYPSTDAAEGQLAARATPAFSSCVASFDADNLTCSCGHLATSLGVEQIPPPPDVHAAVWRDTLTFRDETGTRMAFALRAYVQQGRDVAMFTEWEYGAPPDAARFAELVTSIGQRMAVQSPTG